MISFANDSRSTGQGKTYSLIKYVIEQYLEDKSINWLVPNRSNSEDLFIDFLSHQTFLDNLDNLYNKLSLSQKIQNLKQDHFEDYKISILSSLFQKITLINSFYNVDILLNDKKKGRQIPKKQPKKPINPSDILIIDEIDRTLASLSLKEQSKKLYYLHLPVQFNILDYADLENHYPEYEDWLDDFIKNKLEELDLTNNFFNEQIIKKLNKDTITEKYRYIKENTKISKVNKYKNYQFESEKQVQKYLSVNQYDKIEISLSDYKSQLNMIQESDKPILYVVENYIEESNEYKIYNSEDGQIIFFENIYNIIIKLVKPNGLIIGCSATQNEHVKDLLNECIKINLPYDDKPFINPITFNLIQYKDKDYKETGKSLIIKESKSSSWINRKQVKSYRTNKMTYLQDPNLVGSNDYSDYETFIFDFKFHDVKQAPCNNRLSFYSKIGNGFLKTDKDIKKLTSTYQSFESEFKDQIKNKIIQAVGRLNRANGIKVKNIYVKDLYIYVIIKDIIENKLQQKLIEEIK
jgi:hypothetical protein